MDLDTDLCCGIYFPGRPCRYGALELVNASHFWIERDHVLASAWGVSASKIALWRIPRKSLGRWKVLRSQRRRTLFLEAQIQIALAKYDVRRTREVGGVR